MSGVAAKVEADQYTVSLGDWVFLAIVCLAALSLRLVGISGASLWTDEGYSIWFAQQSFGELWGEIARNEYNPTLYYILLKAWMSVFGESVTSIRSLSAVVNTMTIPFVYLSARWALRSPQAPLAAMLAAVLFTLALAELRYAQEARTYTLCVLAVAMATAATIRIIGALAQLNERGSPSPPAWPFALLGAGAALALWSHYSAMIFLAVLGAFHLWLIWVNRRNVGTIMGPYAISAAVFALLGGRALWLMLAYALPASSNFWIGVPTVSDVIDTTSIVFGGSLGVQSWGIDVFLRGVVFGIWPLIGAFALWQRGHQVERHALLALVAISIVSFGAYLGVTYAGKPVFLQRIVLPAQVGWIILCAASILYFENRRFREIAAGLLVAAFAISTVNYMASGYGKADKEPWSDVAKEIATSAGPGETVYVMATGEILVGYYLKAYERADIKLYSINGRLRTPPPRRYFDRSSIHYASPVSDPALAEFEAHLAGAPSAWLVLRNPDGERWRAVRSVFPSTYDNRFEPGPIGLYRKSGQPAGGTPTGTSLAGPER